MEAAPDELDDLAADDKFIGAFRASHTSGPMDVPSPPPKVTSADLAIVTALPKEREAIEAVFAPGRPLKPTGDAHIYKVIDFHLGAIQRRIVVACLPEAGNSRAAIVAQSILRSFRPRFLALVGIAGGCPEPADVKTHVRLGDVVIADKIIEWDSQYILANDRTKYRDSPQRLGYQWRQAVAALQSEAHSFDPGWRTYFNAAMEKLSLSAPDRKLDKLYNASGRKVRHPVDSRRAAGGIVHVGTIAAGDTLLKDPVIRDRLRTDLGARAVEMEGAGVRDASWTESSELIVVRGVVDYCDQHKNDGWHMSAAIAAASVTRAVYEVILQSETGVSEILCLGP